MRKASLAAVLLLTACDQTPWQGWVYPNRNDLTDDVPIGKFESLESCRASAKATLQRLERFEDGERIVGDYECGYKCEPLNDGSGMKLCERTER